MRVYLCMYVERGLCTIGYICTYIYNLAFDLWFILDCFSFVSILSNFLGDGVVSVSLGALSILDLELQITNLIGL